jgi:hypothetical protein
MPSVIVAPLSLYVAPMGFGQSSVAVTLNQQGGKGQVNRLRWRAQWRA